MSMKAALLDFSEAFEQVLMSGLDAGLCHWAQSKGGLTMARNGEFEFSIRAHLLPSLERRRITWSSQRRKASGLTYPCERFFSNHAPNGDPHLTGVDAARTRYEPKP